MRTHSPLQQFKEAKQIADDHGMFVVEKGERFLLYRRQYPRNLLLGTRTSASGLRTLVCACANFK